MFGSNRNIARMLLKYMRLLINALSAKHRQINALKVSKWELGLLNAGLFEGMIVKDKQRQKCNKCDI